MSTYWILDKHCGYLFPRVNSPWGPLYTRSATIYVEEWSYIPDHQGFLIQDAEGGSLGGPLCPHFFEPKNLVEKDISYGAIKAYAHVFKGAGAILRQAYGAWEKKVDKNAYGKGGKKSTDWNNFSLNDVAAKRLCECVFSRANVTCPDSLGNDFATSLDSDSFARLEKARAQEDLWKHVKVTS